MIDLKYMNDCKEEYLEIFKKIKNIEANIKLLACYIGRIYKDSDEYLRMLALGEIRPHHDIYIEGTDDDLFKELCLERIRLTELGDGVTYVDIIFKYNVSELFISDLDALLIKYIQEYESLLSAGNNDDYYVNYMIGYRPDNIVVDWYISLVFKRGLAYTRKVTTFYPFYGVRICDLESLDCVTFTMVDKPLFFYIDTGRKISFAYHMTNMLRDTQGTRIIYLNSFRHSDFEDTREGLAEILEHSDKIRDKDKIHIYFDSHKSYMLSYYGIEIDALQKLGITVYYSFDDIDFANKHMHRL